MIRSNLSGQSLFEVLFAIAVAALIIVGVTSLAATSIRNASFSRNSTLATRYTQEALEWFRGERDAGWTTFVNRAVANSTYCLSTLNWSSPGPCSSSSNISGTPFTREVTLTCYQNNSSPPPDFNQILDCSDASVVNIQPEVTVSWTDSQGDHSVKAATRLTRWQ